MISIKGPFRGLRTFIEYVRFTCCKDHISIELIVCLMLVELSRELHPHRATPKLVSFGTCHAWEKKGCMAARLFVMSTRRIVTGNGHSSRCATDRMAFVAHLVHRKEKQSVLQQRGLQQALRLMSNEIVRYILPAKSTREAFSACKD
jgi:hypothetical protein